MIINDFHAESVVAFPSEADAPLVIDANTELACTVPLERFQAIPRRRSQVLQPSRRIEDFQLSPGNPLNRPESPYQAVIE
jgi:hypothetical protein